jgi:hypothetical protein
MAGNQPAHAVSNEHHWHSGKSLDHTPMKLGEIMQIVIKRPHVAGFAFRVSMPGMIERRHSIAMAGEKLGQLRVPRTVFSSTMSNQYQGPQRALRFPTLKVDGMVTSASKPVFAVFHDVYLYRWYEVPV